MIFPAQNVSSAEVEKSKPEVSQIAFQSSLTPTIYCFLCCPWSCPPELCSVPTSAPNMRPSPIFLNLLMLFNSVQSLSRVQLLATPWTAACQAFLSITNSQGLLMAIELVMPSNHLILCHPLLLPPSIFPSIRVFSNESVLHIMWPKYGSFSFNISPSSEYSGLISFRMDRLDLLAVQGTVKSLLQHHSSNFKSINSSALSFLHSPTLTSIHDHRKNHSLDWTDLCWQSNVSAFQHAT